MSNFKISLASFVVALLLVAFVVPVFAQNYQPGVSEGQYVRYGNFVGIGPGLETFNNTDWSELQVTDVSGSSVTLLTVGQLKDGSAFPGNGSTAVWDVAAGTLDGDQTTQGPIIAANLNQGDAIPPQGTYTVNRTESRTYLGVSRSVNILDVAISTPDYNSTLTYVYDRASGMLLEAESSTVTQAQPSPVASQYSYSVNATNIFAASTPSPTQSQPATPTATTRTSGSPTQTAQASPTPSPSGGFPFEYILVASAVVVVVVVVAVALALRKRPA